jgi:hypothetical protein
VKDALRNLYRFKPLRTTAQVLATTLLADGTGVLDTDWKAKASISVMSGVVSLLQIFAEGGHMLADDKRVTQTAQLPDEPAAHEPV